MANGMRYTVIFQNNSSNRGDACLFQKDPGGGYPGVMSLAWFTRPAAPTTRIQFAWELAYDFAWSQTGRLAPGVVFSASQVWPADPATQNQVTFTKEGGFYTFKDLTQGPQPGSLTIRQDSTIPMGMASVGIGMSGAATFAVQAQPYMNVMFTPHPEYWIAFGNYMTGEVLDTQSMFNAAKITFPPNIYTMVATLNQDNTWTITPLDTLNAELLKGSKAEAEAA